MNQPKKPLKISKQLSHTATRIFPARRQPTGDILEGPQATGFFWLVDEALFLVTNWHNVTGWDPINNRALNKDAFTPNVVVVNLAYRLKTGQGEALRWGRVVVDLFDDDGPSWLEHPTFANRVDVVALKMGRVDVELWSQPVNTFTDFVDFEPSAGDETFVLGYPKGLDGGANFPIWKRASIASEPDIDLDELPKLLIDTATRPGMSGSPVIAVSRGFTRLRGSTGLGPSPDDIFGTSETFLGVYSGRVDDDPLGAQIGIVWKGRVVEEIINGGTRGKTPFE